MPDYPNLPGTRINRLDGGLRASQTDETPLIMMLGTSTQGPGDEPFDSRDTSRARAVFGGSSELYQGLIEARKAYGEGANIWLFRIGTKPGILTISGTNAKSVKVIPRNRTATVGTTYKASFDEATGYLWVFNELGTLVYANTPVNSVDLGEIEIRGDITLLSGAQSFGDTSGGTLALSVALASGVTSNPLASGTTWTDPTLGPADHDLKARYEALEDAYRLLDGTDLDILVPLTVTADAPNVALFVSGVTTNRDHQPWTSTDNPQVQGSGALGWFNATGPTSSSTDGAWTYAWSDDVLLSGTAAHSDTWATAVARVAADYHEVSFGHQLANFCYQHTKNQSTCIGVIGFEPPASYYIGDIHAWIGDLPTKNPAGTMTADGFGLLGFPDTVGCTAARLNALCHDKATGRDPGLFATDSEFKDEAALADAGGNSIDIGAYISLAAETPLHINSVGGINGYSSSVAPYYAGMIARLDEKEAPTNKQAPGLRIPYLAGKSRLDKLVQAKLVMFEQRIDGSFCVDAPTAATSSSDFRRLSTIRIVSLTEKRVRAIGRRYIGRVSNQNTREAFKAEIEEGLQKLQKRGYLKGYRYDITATPVQDVLGQLYVKLILIVPNELRQIFFTVSLAIE
ncbi:MAG: hypothetical protein E4H01_00050 [Lysobacterales bacterium]|nr:MAG: hypothetical protein E4H01_00050 [Xanthomonadales bacterium]